MPIPDTAILTALGVLITAALGIFPALSAFRQSRANATKLEAEAKSAARKDDMDALRGIITEQGAQIATLTGRVNELSATNAVLQGTTVQLKAEVVALRMENAWLRSEMRKQNIEIPPLPQEIKDVIDSVRGATDGTSGPRDPKNG